LGELFDCQEVNGYTRVRTPFLYPDGDVIDVFVDPDNSTITDLSETTRWLRSQTLSAKRTAKQTRLIEDTCQTAGVEFFRGALMLRMSGNLSDDIVRLSQACIRVSDLWFTFRTRAIEPITEEVATYLDDRKIPFERNETHPGRSGRTWTVDFHTRHSSRSTLVQVLSTGTRGATHRMAEHVLAMWHDLSNLQYGREPLHFVSLFDDTLNVWNEEDFNLLSDYSAIAMWSRPDECERFIAV
jgi:hypothetical protein